MKKKSIYGVIFIALFFFAVAGQAQSDITNLILVNAGFDEQWNYRAADEAENLGSANGGANIKKVYGWKIVSTGDNSAAASYEYGYTGWLNGQDVEGRGAVPDMGYNGSTGGALGISSAWTATNAYGQDVFLPAGSYSIEYVAYNSGATEVDNGRVGWTPETGDAVLSSKTAFTLLTWETETIPFELATVSKGIIQIGINAPNNGSGDVGRIFFDYIKVTCNSINKTELTALIAEANTLYGDGTGIKAAELQAAINAVEAVASQEATAPALINAAIELSKAILLYQTAEANGQFLTQALVELEGILEEAEELISGQQQGYPQSTRNALQTAYESASNAYDEKTLTADNIQEYIDRLRFAIDNYKASQLGLKIHYTFTDVNGNIVTNDGDPLYNGTLYNEAQVLPMGKYKVLSLGNGTGYLDMGSAAGNIISSMDNYTISAYYRIDKGASLSGTGHFLWAFSVLDVNTSTSGPYIYYQLNNQRFVLSTGGWNNESPVTMATASSQEEWHHVVYRQTGAAGELYIDGVLSATNAEDVTMPVPSATFTTPPLYNWIARPPFNNDSYLKNTLVYDFRLYNQAVDDDQIAAWVQLLPDLKADYEHGTKGDFSKLTALIAEYNAFLYDDVKFGDGVGEYLQDAAFDFATVIGKAEEFVEADNGSQFLVDEWITALKTAYDEFKATAGYAVVHPASEGETPYNFESGLYYIEVGNYYLTVPETGKSDTYLQLRPYIDNEDKVHNNQVWNIQYNSVYSDLAIDQALYSIVSDTIVWEEDGTWHMDERGRMKKGNTETAQSEENSNWTWREHMIYFNGEAYSIVNHHDNKAIVFVNETENEDAQPLDVMKFNFKFRTIDDVVANPQIPDAIQAPAVGDKAGISGGINEIVVSGAAAGNAIAVYDISGRLIKSLRVTGKDSSIPVVPGLYIVRVFGQTPTTGKVIVR
jgi:hypothetical protein